MGPSKKKGRVKWQIHYYRIATTIAKTKILKLGAIKCTKETGLVHPSVSPGALSAIEQGTYGSQCLSVGEEANFRDRTERAAKDDLDSKFTSSAKITYSLIFKKSIGKLVENRLWFYRIYRGTVTFSGSLQ